MVRSVAYMYDPSVGNFYYDVGHPMKPFRISLTHDLVFSYNLHNKMKVYLPRKSTKEDLLKFHSEDYVDCLLGSSGSVCNNDCATDGNYNVGLDCPRFPGLFDFCCLYTGASIEAARALNFGEFDIAINWSGGLHHAKKNKASGFCYVNDIVLAILELLKFHPRVLYIDIDIHHGDGVQEAFYISDRVMCLSFHNYDGKYYPGTGNVNERGMNQGLNFSLNVPLRAGIDDESYMHVFKVIVSDTVARFQPSCIVLQCGADSIAKDKLGCFNLSVKGHGACVQYVKSFNIPLLVLGGGGYKIRNVSRCWAYETSLLVDVLIEDKIPESSRFYQLYGPTFDLHPPIDTTIMNQNSKSLLEVLISNAKSQLKCIEGCPSVQIKPVKSLITRFPLAFDESTNKGLGLDLHQ